MRRGAIIGKANRAEAMGVDEGCYLKKDNYLSGSLVEGRYSGYLYMGPFWI